MAALVHQLDTEVASWRSLTFAESTKATYKSQRRLYLEFCRAIKVSPVPACSQTICRYAAYLGRTRAFTTVQQYLNIIRILHIELGFDNPLHNNWPLKSLLKGMRRGKGNQQQYKLPITPHDLRRIHSQLHMQQPADSLLWAGILTCFFGLLRVSNVSVHPGKSPKTLLWSQMSVTPNGVVLSVTASKTIQNQERCLPVTLPYIPGNPLCPTAALLQLLSYLGTGSPSAISSSPIFSVISRTGRIDLTPAYIRRRLQSLLANQGLTPSDYGTHSLRRGGATWLITRTYNYDNCITYMYININCYWYAAKQYCMGVLLALRYTCR